jgi:hypothetical protein
VRVLPLQFAGRHRTEGEVSFVRLTRQALDVGTSLERNGIGRWLAVGHHVLLPVAQATTVSVVGRGCASRMSSSTPPEARKSSPRHRDPRSRVRYLDSRVSEPLPLRLLGERVEGRLSLLGVRALVGDDVAF